MPGLPRPARHLIRGERVHDNLRSLSRFGQISNGGGTDRPVFSPAYRAAIDWIAAEMRAIGMVVQVDAAGNLIGRLGPPQGPALLSGSHIDTVPGGGQFDGMLGVIGALEVARVLAEAATPLRCAFEVIAFADEEGAFVSLLGVRAFVGELPQDEVFSATGRDGDRLVDAMRGFGLSPDQLQSAARDPADILAFVELHIEQGPVLESEDLDIGIVDHIVGLQTSQLVFRGQANHAGTTPHALRADAFRAACAVVSDAFACVEQGFGPDARLTFGHADIRPGASNVVPNEVRLTQEIRATTAYDISAIRETVLHRARDVVGRFGVTVNNSVISEDAPATMSPIVTDAIGRACDTAGLHAKRMLSGAGHDSQVICKHVPTGMIFVPSRNGLSHNPAEYTAPKQVEQGVQVLCDTVFDLFHRLA